MSYSQTEADLQARLAEAENLLRECLTMRLLASYPIDGPCTCCNCTLKRKLEAFLNPAPSTSNPKPLITDY